jgi:hemoglobin
MERNLSNSLSSPSRRDLADEVDIRLMVESFYQKVQSDDLLGPIFNDVAQVNWETHIPHLCDFWSDLIFRTRKFNGRPWPKHAGLPVQREHFARWLQLFHTTVDDLFEGPRAIAAKGYASSIADTFQMRMGLLPQSLRISPAPSGPELSLNSRKS